MPSNLDTLHATLLQHGLPALSRDSFYTSYATINIGGKKLEVHDSSFGGARSAPIITKIVPLLACLLKHLDLVTIAKVRGYGNHIAFKFSGGHFKINFSSENTYGTLEVLRRSETGKFVSAREIAITDLDAVIAIIDEEKAIVPPKIVREQVDLGEPHEFIDGVEFTAKAPFRRISHFITAIHSAKAVAMTAESRIVDGVDNPALPSVWILLDCHTYDPDKAPKTVPFMIITDGDRWYQVEKVGKYLKAVNHTTRGITRDIVLTTMDQELVMHALSTVYSYSAVA